MKQVTILSGKGGTGKTTLAAMIAHRSAGIIVVDCDVDAANLALVLPGRDGPAHEFFAGRRAYVRSDDCVACGRCLDSCPFGAIAEHRGDYAICRLACDGCGACARACPQGCIDFEQNRAGAYWVRRLEHGVLVHAELGVAQDNSGKLVAELRHVARQLGAQRGASLVLIDGPPGIGCPVHASVTGSDLALLIAEASPAGAHDLHRALTLCRNLRVQAAVALNKCGVHPGAEVEILERCATSNVPVWARIPFDLDVGRLLARGTLPLELDSPAGRELRRLADRVEGFATEPQAPGPTEPTAPSPEP